MFQLIVNYSSDSVATVCDDLALYHTGVVYYICLQTYNTMVKGKCSQFETQNPTQSLMIVIHEELVNCNLLWNIIIKFY